MKWVSLLLMTLLCGCGFLSNPAYVEVATRNSMKITIQQTHLSAKQVHIMKTILTDLRPVLYAALSNKSDDLAGVTTTFLTKYDESVGTVVDTVLQAGLIEVQELMKNSETEQAKAYLDATLKGALAGLP